MTQYQWNTQTITQHERKTYRGVTHRLFACENYCPNNIFRSDGHGRAVLHIRRELWVLHLRLDSLFMFLLLTAENLSWGKQKTGWWRLFWLAQALCLWSESSVCGVVVCTVLLPPGGKFGHNRTWERQMASAAKTLSIYQQGNSWGVSTPMGFYHHRANRISLRKKNDSLCNSGGYMAMSANKQRAMTVIVCKFEELYGGV